MRRILVGVVLVVAVGACAADDPIASAETCAELEQAMQDATAEMSDPSDQNELNEILALVLERRQELETRAINGNDTAEMESCATMDMGASSTNS